MAPPPVPREKGISDEMASTARAMVQMRRSYSPSTADRTGPAARPEPAQPQGGGATGQPVRD